MKMTSIIPLAISLFCLSILLYACGPESEVQTEAPAQLEDSIISNIDTIVEPMDSIVTEELNDSSINGKVILDLSENLDSRSRGLVHYFSGKVTESNETGRGPEWFYTLKSEAGEEFTFYLMGFGMDGPAIGSNVKVSYIIVEEKWILGIRLADETIDEALAALEMDAEYLVSTKKDYEAASYTVEDVTYLEGQQGDMAFYITVKNSANEEATHDGYFHVGDGDMSRYTDQKVELYGELNKENSVVKIELE
jgi:hypothetical protein